MNNPLTLACAVVSLALALGPAASAAPTLSREDFNRLAASSGLPLFWNAVPEGALRPEALVPVGVGADLSRWVAGNRFTAEFDRAYARLVEARRLEAVGKELDQGRPTVLFSDFRDRPPAERGFVEHIAAASRIVEELYLRQKGADRYRDALAPDDASSRVLFERNQGPWCEAPKTEHDPFCSAAPAFPPRKSDAYPEELAEDAALCDRLKARPDAARLLDPFTVVRGKGKSLAALPLTEAYGETMGRVALELSAAATSLGSDEAPLKRYLLGAAGGFRTNDWSEADEAWSVMGSRNSKWYLRVGPDETGFETCQEKAGFHLSFALIDRTSLAWQDRLLPLRQEMEDSLAALIGPPYQAQAAGFSFPDFIRVVLNAGDSRMGLGAVAGQSLPNWGKVAAQGRRRTMVMTNIGEDPDSRRMAREKARQLLDAEAMASFPEDSEPRLLGTILHEAAHNLGPDTDFRVGGKNPSEVFGGRMDGVLEELKAQTAALWYVDLLRRKGLVSAARAKQIYTSELAWAFGHISTGMFEASGSPKPYAQLAAVQVAGLVAEGALRFGPADGDGVERFHVDYDKLPAAVESLMRRIGRIKATGDAAQAKEWVEDCVTGPGSKRVRMETIRERLLQFPKETYRYTVLY